MPSIVIKATNRALNKVGQSKELRDVRVADLHPNVKYNDYFISKVFGVSQNGMVKILKSDCEEFLENELYSIHDINVKVGGLAKVEHKEPVDLHYFM